jgi:hypothetical protein
MSGSEEKFDDSNWDVLVKDGDLDASVARDGVTNLPWITVVGNNLWTHYRPKFANPILGGTMESRTWNDLVTGLIMDRLIRSIRMRPEERIDTVYQNRTDIQDAVISMLSGQMRTKGFNQGTIDLMATRWKGLIKTQIQMYMRQKAPKVYARWKAIDFAERDALIAQLNSMPAGTINPVDATGGGAGMPASGNASDPIDGLGANVTGGSQNATGGASIPVDPVRNWYVQYTASSVASFASNDDDSPVAWPLIRGDTSWNASRPQTTVSVSTTVESPRWNDMITGIALYRLYKVVTETADATEGATLTSEFLDNISGLVYIQLQVANFTATQMSRSLARVRVLVTAYLRSYIRDLLPNKYTKWKAITPDDEGSVVMGQDETVDPDIGAGDEIVDRDIPVPGNATNTSNPVPSPTSPTTPSPTPAPSPPIGPSPLTPRPRPTQPNTPSQSNEVGTDNMTTPAPTTPAPTTPAPTPGPNGPTAIDRSTDPPVGKAFLDATIVAISAPFATVAQQIALLVANDRKQQYETSALFEETSKEQLAKEAAIQASLRVFLPIAGSSELDDQESSASIQLKADNLLMGRYKPANWPLGNVDNPFWVQNMATVGRRYAPGMYQMPEILSGGNLTDGATLYGSHPSTPVNVHSAYPPPTQPGNNKRKRYKR